MFCFRRNVRRRLLRKDHEIKAGHITGTERFVNYSKNEVVPRCVSDSNETTYRQELCKCKYGHERIRGPNRRALTKTEGEGKLAAAFLTAPRSAGAIKSKLDF